MTFPHLSTMLRLGRPLVALFLFGASVAALLLLFKTVEATGGNPEVRLVMNTTSPNLFSALHGMKASFEDGQKADLSGGSAHRAERGPLPALRLGPAGFELVADPQAPLLRYAEPNPWKRLALLYLGASNDYQSLAWVLFLALAAGCCGGFCST